MKPSEILEKAADLIEPEGKWFQGSYGAKNGKAIVAGIDLARKLTDADCWCAAGAIIAASPDEYAERRANDFLCRVLGVAFDVDNEGIGQWNDNDLRTQSEVVATLRKAASLAKEQEAV
jgi:hypothetical protein